MKKTPPPILVLQIIKPHKGIRIRPGAFCLPIMTNPRYANGNFRRKMRARFKAADAPCGICQGRLGPIHYEEPSNAQHPLSFVIDERFPVSRWQEFGYSSPEAACKDINNLVAAHYICNANKSNKTVEEMHVSSRKGQRDMTSGAW